MRLYEDKALDQRGLAYLWQKILDLVKKAVPTKVSQLENDKGYVTKDETTGYTKEEVDTLLSHKEDTIIDLNSIRRGAAAGMTAVQTEVDPTVPSWAKSSTKPGYNLDEVLDGSTRKLADKADKVVNANNGRLAGLNSSGNLVDSGIVGENVADEELTIDEISSLINF